MEHVSEEQYQTVQLQAAAERTGQIMGEIE
jgi:hypothetical protein